VQDDDANHRDAYGIGRPDGVRRSNGAGCCFVPELRIEHY
jgi:hypothetical protein